jgi:thiol-disulfide isomerase/thioredoxin
MKPRLVAGLILLAPLVRLVAADAAGVVSNADSSAPASATADADWTVLQAIAAEEPANADKMTSDQRLRWTDDYAARYNEKALLFIEKYPTDPRRWQAVVLMIERPRLFLKPFPPGGEPPATATDQERLRALMTNMDSAAALDWRKKTEELGAAMFAAPDATDNQRALVASQELKRALSAAFGRSNDEMVEYWAKIEAFAQKYPASPIPYALASQYLNLMTRRGAAYTEPTLKKMAASSHAKISEFAAGKLRAAELQKAPLELKFTAVDGRDVDLAKLRGKVVLIDFWATWCGPCIAELPNVKKVFAAYHDRGFEVIGIALEDGKLTAKDTPEQTSEKMAKAKKILTDFTAKENMPWPQYFDGKYWKNEISTQHAINSIPAMFLLDQEGKVVSTNARGPLLESEVKRLLKL